MKEMLKVLQLFGFFVLALLYHYISWGHQLCVNFPLLCIVLLVHLNLAMPNITCEACVNEHLISVSP